jgi:hypothetical protein
MKYLILATFLIVFSSVHAAPLQQGTYLSAEYIEKLKTTQSTKQALDLDAEPSSKIPTSFEVEHVGKKTLFREGWYFHEGGGEFVRRADGQLEVTVSVGREGQPTLNILNNHEFAIQWADFKSRYIFVGDAPRWVAEQLLVGVYRAKNGSEVKFRADGSACLLKGETDYVVEMDHVTVNYNDSISGKHYNYAFQRRKDELLLFQIVTKDEDDEGSIEKPFWRGVRQPDADVNEPCS